MRVPCCFAVALISALALAQNLSGLPACACLCMNVNFGYGIRDCSVETCATAQDAQTAITFATEFCASILAPVGPAPTSSFGQPSSTTATALQATTQAPSGSSTAPIPTTLITTSDSAGNIFTVTGEILISGTSSTTVPCRTVITTNTAGVTVTSTETGLSVTAG
ncbi:hypothetical protein EDB80DRAFT_775082 [Ilyonectria destructans]|nr:hypothetical protein EDB80DRAFT_775082 [Ilyonectria destructans]